MKGEMPYVIAATFLLLVVSCCARAEGYMVFGDSQSFVVQDTNDARHNWPYLVQQFTGKHMFNLSRGGRRLSDGHVADYLRLADVHRLNQQADGIIIALGSLDALFQADPIPALRDAIHEAQARELDVICLLPPDNQLMTNEQVRAEIAAVCPYSIDMSAYIGPADMVDPVHLGKEGHAKYATSLVWALAIQEGERDE